MPIGQFRPRIIRQVHQHRPCPRRPPAIQIKAVITDHHHFARRYVPGLRQFQQTTGVRFWRRFISTEHVLHREAVSQANGLQRDMRQFTGIARENAQAIPAPGQVTHQLYGTRCRFRPERQVALVLEQPRMLGSGFVGR